MLSGRSRSRTSWALVLTLLSWGAGEAHAQSLTPRDAARTLANQAADAIARGDYAEGEALLGRAFQQFPAPTIALLHARTLVRLGRLADAVDAYQRASLSMLPPDAPDAFRSAAASANVELAALRPRVPRLQVNVRAAGSGSQRVLLRLDGKSVPASQLGRWFLVDPGRRIIGIDWGGVSYERVLRIDEGQSVVTEVVEPRTSPAARW
jgi:tetratricopeptide (TPR) repeat protein